MALHWDGYVINTLVGIEEPDRAVRLLPQLERCAILYSPYTNPPHGLAEGDQLITCYMRDGEIVEFEALVWPHPCIHPPWLDGYNRKMIELLAVDGNWPPADDHQRATLLRVRETWDAVAHLNWPS